MKYYLETNALYSIGKFPDKYFRNFYTSILSLYELVSGIKKENFTKRKNVLNKIFNTSITIVWEMPEKLVFSSFNVTKDYEYLEHRVEPLRNIINKILNSDSYETFSQSTEYRTEPYNFNYFRELDKSWSKGFIESTIRGNQRIKHDIKRNNNSFILNGVSYNIHRNKDLASFYEAETLLNQSITILALSNMIKEKGLTDAIGTIYNSYNGLIDNYIVGFSMFCADKMIMSDSPATNDFVDLTHLIYLTNVEDCKIVSNDNIFDKFFEHKRIKIEELTNN